MSTQTLNETEQTLLESCERDIAENLTSWRKLGAALNEVRESRLYRLTHDTFEDYCEVKWGISRSHGNGLADAARVLRKLPPHLSAVVDNERQARELVKLSEDKRVEVMTIVADNAQKTGGKVTAAKIHEAARSKTSTSTVAQTHRGPLVTLPSSLTPERIEKILADDTERLILLADRCPEELEAIEVSVWALLEAIEAKRITRDADYARDVAVRLRKLAETLDHGDVVAWAQKTIQATAVEFDIPEQIESGVGK